MSIGNAGANKARNQIAYVGPWTVLGDDFGAYGSFSGATKWVFYSEGTGAGWGISIYDGASNAIDNAVFGTYNPNTNTRLSPLPPPPIPTAAYGAALAIPETDWSLTIGPSAQGAPGVNESNPMVSTGVNAVKLFSSYPLWWVRAKVTTVGTGTLLIWAIQVP
jgi:hypothetical protein